jgi:hypothetical protein
MVVIRRLQPSVKIALPAKPKRARPSQAKVQRRTLAEYPPPTPQPTPCRLWQGAVDRFGYGRMKRGDKTVRVYRWVVEQALGRKLRRDEFVLHACDNPPCYRLDHLSVGSALDNNRDMMTKGRFVPPPVTKLLGAMHPQAKFTAMQAARIRHDYRTGVRAKTLAGQYGVDVRTIRRLVEGVTYAESTAYDLIGRDQAEEDQ